MAITSRYIDLPQWPWASRLAGRQVCNVWIENCVYEIVEEMDVVRAVVPNRLVFGFAAMLSIEINRAVTFE